MTTNEPFGTTPHFQNKMGDKRQFSQRDGINSTKTKVFQQIDKRLIRHLCTLVIKELSSKAI